METTDHKQPCACGDCRDHRREAALNAAKEHPEARRSAAAGSAAPAVNLRNVLIVLAADMLMTDEIPSSIADDWDFSKSTTLRDKVKVIGYARRSREQCRKWALRLRDIADSLPNREL